MNLLQSDETVEVVEPSFDRPHGADISPSMISVGTRVELSYQARPVFAQIEAIERLGTSFVGRTMMATRLDDPGAFRPGELIRFRLPDICHLV